MILWLRLLEIKFQSNIEKLRLQIKKSRSKMRKGKWKKIKCLSIVLWQYEFYRDFPKIRNIVNNSIIFYSNNPHNQQSIDDLKVHFSDANLQKYGKYKTIATSNLYQTLAWNYHGHHKFYPLIYLCEFALWKSLVDVVDRSSLFDTFK